MATSRRATASAPYLPSNSISMPSSAKSQRTATRRQNWKLEFANSFEEAEQQTRAYWRDASPAVRLNALEQLRQPFYAANQTSPGLQRFLELVPFP